MIVKLTKHLTKVLHPKVLKGFIFIYKYIDNMVLFVVFKVNCPLMRPGPVGNVPSVGVLSKGS